MILHDDDGAFRLSLEDELIVAAWRAAPTVERLRIVERAMRDSARRLGYVNAILGGSNEFPPEVRAEVARLGKDASLHLAGVAHLIKLPGWKGPAARAFVRAAIAVAETPAPNRVFRDEESCAAWMCERLGAGWTIARATRMIRATLVA